MTTVFKGRGLVAMAILLFSTASRGAPPVGPHAGSKPEAAPSPTAIPQAAAPLVFPCELGDGKGNPTLRIISPSSSDQKLVTELLRKGAFGELSLAFEDISGQSKQDHLKRFPTTNPKTARLTVFSDGLIPGLVDSVEKYVSLFRLENRKRRLDALAAPKSDDDKEELATAKNKTAGQLGDLKLYVVEDFKTNSFKYQGWKALDRPLKNENSEKLAVALDGLFQVRENQIEWQNTLATLKGTPIWNSSEAWTSLLKEMAIAYGRFTENKYQQSRTVPSLESYNALIEDPLDNKKEHTFTDEVIAKVVKQAAETVTKLYCDALKEKKELHVVTSDLYFQRLLEEIIKVADNKVPIKFRQAGHDFEMENGEPVDVTPFPVPMVEEAGFAP